ncbi:MAG: hypothetical protein RSB70_05800 [Clostridium sp.]
MILSREFNSVELQNKDGAIERRLIEMRRKNILVIPEKGNTTDLNSY